METPNNLSPPHSPSPPPPPQPAKKYTVKLKRRPALLNPHQPHPHAPPFLVSRAPAPSIPQPPPPPPTLISTYPVQQIHSHSTHHQLGNAPPSLVSRAPAPSIPQQPALISSDPVPYYKPRKPCFLPDLNYALPEAMAYVTDEDDGLHAAIAISKRWNLWTVRSTPPGFPVENVDVYLCKLHADFIEAGITPVEDVWNQLPTQLTVDRRFNAPGGYVLFVKRNVSKSGVNVVRKVVDSNAKWKDRHGTRRLAGLDGEVGVVYRLVLKYGKQHSDWFADEFVATNSEDGTSSVVFLRCTDPEWLKYETLIEEAEKRVTKARQKLIDTEQNNLSALDLKNAEVTLLMSQACLGKTIRAFQENRYKLQLKQIEAAAFSGSNAAAAAPVLASGLPVRDLQTIGDASSSVASPGLKTFGPYFLKVTASIDSKTKKKLIEKDKKEDKKEKEKKEKEETEKRNDDDQD